MMMGNARRGTAATLAALALLATTACSSSTPEAEGPQERTLEILTWTYEGVSQEWWETINAQFEKEHPGVKIVMEQSESSAIIKDFVTQATAGQTAAVVHIPAPLLTTLPWAEAGFLVPLTDWMEETGIADDLAADQVAMNWEGETYGLVFAYNARMLYVNAGALEDNGVAVPTTPEELLAAATALDGWNGGDGYGFTTGDEDSLNFVNETLTFVAGMGGEYVKDGEWNWTDPTVVEAIDLFATLGREHSPRGTSINDKYMAFETGNTAMMVDWTFRFEAAVRSATPEVSDQITLAVPPFPRTPIHISQGFGVSSAVDEETQELAKDFLELALSEESQRLYASIEPVVPANLAARAVIGEEEATRPILEALQRDTHMIVPAEYIGIRLNFAEFQSILNGVIRQLLQGEGDAASAMADLQSRLEVSGLHPMEP